MCGSPAMEWTSSALQRGTDREQNEKGELKMETTQLGKTSYEETQAGLFPFIKESKM